MTLPAFLKPLKPGAEDTECMNLRVSFLDRLYKMDGRESPNHPFHAVYTGLAERYYP